MINYDKLVNILTNKYKVVIHDSLDEGDKNYSFIVGNEIFMGEYDDNDIKIIALFHEVGHFASCNQLNIKTTMSIISGEGIAWEFGISIAKNYGFVYDYYSKELK